MRVSVNPKAYARVSYLLLAKSLHGLVASGARVGAWLFALYPPCEPGEGRHQNEYGKPKCKRPGFDDERGEGGEGGRGWDREDPSPYDAASDAPSHGAESAGGAGAHDGARHHLRRAHGQPPRRCQLDHGRGDRLGGEPIDRLHPDDPGPHRADDAPTPGPRPEADRKGGGERDPRRDGELRKVARAKQGEGDDSHSLLRIVGSVAKCDETAGEELKSTERTVGLARTRSAEQVEKNDGEHVCYEEAGDRRRDQGDEDRVDLTPLHRIDPVHRKAHTD